MFNVWLESSVFFGKAKLRQERKIKEMDNRTHHARELERIRSKMTNW